MVKVIHASSLYVFNDLNLLNLVIYVLDVTVHITTQIPGGMFMVLSLERYLNLNKQHLSIMSSFAIFVFGYYLVCHTTTNEGYTLHLDFFVSLFFYNITMILYLQVVVSCSLED